MKLSGRSLRHRSGRVASVALAVGLVAWIGGANFASGAGSFSPPSVGVLRLHLGASDYLRFDAASGSGYAPGTPQPITVGGGCAAAIPSTLLAIAPIPAPPKGTVGLVSDGIGVQVKGEGNGQPCGRVDGTQALVLDLAGSLAGYEMDYAELDIEGKFGATVRAELSLDGRPVGVETLRTGVGSDSGPDSGDGDNFRWRLPAPGSRAIFDRIVLRVDSSTPDGAFSLEGGADGTAPEPGGLGSALGTNDSLFHLTDIDGSLGCGDSAVAGGVGVPNAGLERLANGSGTGADCVAVPYLFRSNVDGDGQVVFLWKDLEGQVQNEPRFRMSIAWNPETSAYPVERRTEIDYDDGNGLHLMKWCNGTAAAPELPAGEFWCIAGQSAALIGSGQIQVTEEFYGAGDPSVRRR